MVALRVITASVLLLVAVVAHAQPVEVKGPQQKILASADGRFVFGQISDGRADQFLLDTKTGRLWLRVKGEEDRTLMQPVPIIQILGYEAYIPDPDDEVEAHREFFRKDYFEQAK